MEGSRSFIERRCIATLTRYHIVYSNIYESLNTFLLIRVAIWAIACYLGALESKLSSDDRTTEVKIAKSNKGVVELPFKITVAHK